SFCSTVPGYRLSLRKKNVSTIFVHRIGSTRALNRAHAAAVCDGRASWRRKQRRYHRNRRMRHCGYTSGADRHGGRDRSIRYW
ncbi:MAG: hypothetical protein ACFFCW_42855, partial [Candidatus Hodarchaeota archaeon]